MHPCRARPGRRCCILHLQVISIPVPLAGARPTENFSGALVYRFQPMRPVRGATFATSERSSSSSFQSTHPLWGAMTIRLMPVCISSISIHAPLAERDGKNTQRSSCVFAITDEFQQIFPRIAVCQDASRLLLKKNKCDLRCEAPVLFCSLMLRTKRALPLRQKDSRHPRAGHAARKMRFVHGDGIVAVASRHRHAVPALGPDKVEELVRWGRSRAPCRA